MYISYFFTCINTLSYNFSPILEIRNGIKIKCRMESNWKVSSVLDPQQILWICNKFSGSATNARDPQQIHGIRNTNYATWVPTAPTVGKKCFSTYIMKVQLTNYQ